MKFLRFVLYGKERNVMISQFALMSFLTI